MGVELLNTGNNTIEQIELVADLNSEFKFQEVTNQPVYRRGVLGYQFSSSFIQATSNKVNFVCVRIASVNGIQDSDLSNNSSCEKGFNENIYLNIFPNPVSQFLNLEYVLPDRGELRINIYNQMGQPVLKQVSAFMEEGIYKIQYNTSGLSPGLYHYEFVFKGTKRSGTFVKQ